MDEKTAREMGHVRFGVISPLLSADDPRSLKVRFTEQSEKIWTLPDGRLRQFTRTTIEDWFYAYRNSGMDALINPPRKDCGTHRVVSELICQAIDDILAAHPTLKSSNVIRLLDERQLRINDSPSDATLYRYLRKIRPSYQKRAQERRAFEAPYAGNLYQTDIMYGPSVKVRLPNGRSRREATYLLAIIDDHSRLICHGEFFLSQNLMVYLTVLEKAIRKRGIPDKIYCDNGKVFLSGQVVRIGMEIGSRIVHTKVRDAAAKGKIERFFKTVRDQFLELATLDGVNTLMDLNSRFFKWVEEYNTRKHSSLGCSPMEKWLKSPRIPRLLENSPRMDDLFLLEVTRLVKKDGTFSLLGKRFETSYIHAGRKITARYDKNDLTRVHVYYKTDYLGPASPCDPNANNGLPRKGNKV
jgi:transposase InsO family protein